MRDCKLLFTFWFWNRTCRLKGYVKSKKIGKVNVNYGNLSDLYGSVSIWCNWMSPITVKKKVTQNRSILMIDLHQFSFHVGEHLAIIASQRGKTRIDYSLGKIQRQQNRKNYIRKNEIGYGWSKVWHVFQLNNLENVRRDISKVS